MMVRPNDEIDSNAAERIQRCPGCGYALVGITLPGRCSECGERLTQEWIDNALPCEATLGLWRRIRGMSSLLKPNRVARRMELTPTHPLRFRWGIVLTSLLTAFFVSSSILVLRFVAFGIAYGLKWSTPAKTFTVGIVEHADSGLRSLNRIYPDAAVWGALLAISTSAVYYVWFRNDRPRPSFVECGLLLLPGAATYFCLWAMVEQWVLEGLLIAHPVSPFLRIVAGVVIAGLFFRFFAMAAGIQRSCRSDRK